MSILHYHTVILIILTVFVIIRWKKYFLDPELKTILIMNAEMDDFHCNGSFLFIYLMYLFIFEIRSQKL